MLFRSLVFQPKTRAIPLIVKSQRGIAFGRFPDITEELKLFPSSGEIKIGNLFETRTLQKNLKNTPGLKVTEQGERAIPIISDIIAETKGVKSKFISQLPETTERLPKAGTDVIYKIVKEENAAIFGSAARRGQIDRKSTRLNSSHIQKSRMPSSA